MHDWYDEADGVLASLRRELVEGGRLAPVGSDLEANRRWGAFEVAALVEACLGVHLEPESLGELEQLRWQQRVREHDLAPRLHPPGKLAGRFWLLEDGRPVGITTLDLRAYGRTWQELGVLYVRRAARQRGVATRFLAELSAAATRPGLTGVRTALDWSWQRSLRFLLDRGLWVASWQQEVRLALEPRFPAWRFELDGDTARLDVLADHRRVTVCQARRDGDQLRPSALTPTTHVRAELVQAAVPTFGVLLALRGWPYLRTEAEWRERVDRLRPRGDSPA